MMKMKYSALLLATSLLAAPAFVSAAEQGESSRGHQGKYSQMKDSGDTSHKGMYKAGYHNKRGHGKQGHGMGGYMIDAERFEQYLEQRLAKLDTPELKAQFIATYQARLASAKQSMLLRKLMAEHKAEQIADKELKAATLEKITADNKLKQVRIKQVQDVLTKAKK